jgi:tRNA-splicing ligase RtcB (3'-phosphate/5'-hydroxy nucleic acid ligase)
MKKRKRNTHNTAAFTPRKTPAPCRQWGTDIEPEALRQMDNACMLPVSVRGALVPDAHTGYGLPIGGVLATENAVIPYAVGVDIACRMKMTVLDLPVSAIGNEPHRLKDSLCSETAFGVGAEFRAKRNHAVMDEDWSFSAVLQKNKDKAWSQLGTSGAGNHFVEYGVLTLKEADLGLAAGKYLALLSHSGSRGTGNSAASYYSRLAMDKHPELPKELAHLAWLDIKSNDGIEYWLAMELMGRYAAANHELIHRSIAQSLGVEVLLDIENHHNFAWKERHGGKEVIVHRKGATPAAKGDIGIIPGSMATPAYIVRGRGCGASLNSASHGAGRKMSRRQAKDTFSWSQLKKYLAEKDVELISATLDEVPMAYKDIEEVMKAQSELVEPIARFDPRIVRMAGS